MAIRLYVILLLFLVASAGSLFGQRSILDASLVLEKQRGTVREMLEAIETKAGIQMAWAPNQLQSSRKVQLSGKEKSLGEHLETVLAGEYVRIVVRRDRVILARASQPLRTNDRPEVRRFTLQGQVREEGSGEALIGAAVYDPISQQGTYTNEYGFFSLTLPKGIYQVQFQYVGYATQSREIDFSSPKKIEVRLRSKLEIETVEINDEEAPEDLHEGSAMGKHTLNMENEGTLPVLGGESDVLKTMQLLPGVHGGMDGASGLFVRGGGADQNLINLDGVPVYNANHVIGVVSVFNSASINSASIQKGAFPARYAGRLSSLVDVRMKEGNMEKLEGEVGIGVLATKLSIEGPIVKDKTSFILSGRRTWLDLLAVPVQALFGEARVSYFFHDLNAKINHRISDKDRIYLSGYSGIDKIRLKNVLYRLGTDDGDDNTDISWGNKIASLRWNHIFGSRLFANTTLTYSRYKFSILQEIVQSSDTSWFQRLRFNSESSIQDWGGRVDFDYFPSPNHTLRFGGGTIYHTFSPSTNQLDQVFLTSDTSYSISADKKFAHEPFVYIDDDIRISSRLRINPGLHVAAYLVGKQQYLTLQPRFSARYQLKPKSSFRFSYGRMAQFIHLLTNPGIGVPVDLWVPSTETVRPALAHQLSLGYYRNLAPGINLRTEIFYKRMHNLLEYSEGYNYLTNSPEWEEQVESGKGWSYGAELMLEKTNGNLTGWLSYTWAKADRKFENLNFGKTFPFRYDRRHDFNWALTYKVNQKLSFGGVFVFGTGNAATVGLTRFLASTPTVNGQQAQVVPAEQRNNYRTPAYHRLDIAVNLDKTNKLGERRWSFGIYNVYNHINPTFIFSYPNPDGSVSLYKRGLMPLIPFASYRLRF